MITSLGEDDSLRRFDSGYPPVSGGRELINKDLPMKIPRAGQWQTQSARPCFNNSVTRGTLSNNSVVQMKTLLTSHAYVAINKAATPPSSLLA